MNKQEKIISLLLGLALVWCLFSSVGAKRDAVRRTPSQTVKMQSDTTTNAVSPVVSRQTSEAMVKPVKEQPKKALPSTPEEIVVLENDELKLELSSWGGVVKKATLKQYAQKLGEISETNPAVELDFSKSPLGEVGGLAAVGVGSGIMEFRVKEKTATEVVFENEFGPRKVTLAEGYKVEFEDGWFNLGPHDFTLSLGSMDMGHSANDILSVDSWALDAGKGKEGVIHHGDDNSPLKPFLVGGVVGGCGCSKPAAPPDWASKSVSYPSAQRWIALKDRFFVVALASNTAHNKGFTADIERDLKSVAYRPGRISAKAVFSVGEATAMKSVFYVGPKKQSLLWDLGMKDVMEFGMWRWICYPVVWLLTNCHAVIPSYGVAIILLTILVRLLFWPLTRKSTEGMKKMQEIQPLMKELQAKYKDNPQRLQQETWALYREKKVNPLSSCLPMLIQIPVFIALFNVLRSAVELRYADFLWIADLSEPEHLFASWFPFGGLNILPLLMAATMFLQSKLTPSAGDASQQRMMTVFMPLMMLVMFYNFASALSLYWTLSQVLSIVQMWMIRRESARKRQVFEPEVIDPPTPTRQMRRHGSVVLALALIGSMLLAGCGGGVSDTGKYEALCKKAGMTGEVLETALSNYENASDKVRKSMLKSLQDILDRPQAEEDEE